MIVKRFDDDDVKMTQNFFCAQKNPVYAILPSDFFRWIKNTFSLLCKVSGRCLEKNETNIFKSSETISSHVKSLTSLSTTTRKLTFYSLPPANRTSVNRSQSIKPFTAVQTCPFMFDMCILCSGKDLSAITQQLAVIWHDFRSSALSRGASIINATIIIIIGCRDWFRKKKLIHEPLISLSKCDDTGPVQFSYSWFGRKKTATMSPGVVTSSEDDNGATSEEKKIRIPATFSINRGRLELQSKIARRRDPPASPTAPRVNSLSCPVHKSIK